MGLFNINYYNKVVEWLPPFKRYGVMVKFLRALIHPIQYLRDKYLGDYKEGTIAQEWVAGTYPIEANVIRKQVVYQSLIDGNVSQPPSGDWEIYLPSFIGVDERIKFNGAKLVLEYALNKYYRTNFRQPPLVSDIYISNDGKVPVGFLVGKTKGSSVSEHDAFFYVEWSISIHNVGDIVRFLGRMYTSLSNSNADKPPSVNWYQTDTIGYSKTFARLSNFTVYVPTLVYNTPLNLLQPNIEPELRQFVDKIIPTGLKYTVLPY